jgi:Cytochrome c554 and c-prime
MIHSDGNQLTFFIVLSVLLFMLLGIAILVVIDHKSKIPGSFRQDPFSISGMRREHPVISFLTALILGSIIIVLLIELTVTLGEHAGLFKSEEEKKPEILQTLRLERFTEDKRHFHNEALEDKVNMGKKPVCFQCHGDYPHSKEPMVRTLMNMHTQFAGCMTCHADEKEIPENTYTFRWLNYSGIDVQGPHFGTSNNSDTGYLVDTDDYYSKIVVYAEQQGKEKLLEVTEDQPEVQEFLKVKDSINDRDKEALKKRFHKLVRPKGRACSRCHTEEEKSYLPFRELGFSDNRVNNLTNLNIIGIIEKYNKFFMPNLFQASQNEIKNEEK